MRHIRVADAALLPERRHLWRAAYTELPYALILGVRKSPAASLLVKERNLMDHVPARRRSPSPLSGSRWQFLGRATAALSLAALLTGCAQSVKSAEASPTAIISVPTNTPSPTPLPPAPLKWRVATLPAGGPSTVIAVAPSDAATAYDCQAPDISGSTGPIEPPRFWATHDFAAHWTRMANIPADKLNNQCVLRVDQLNPSIVVAILTWMPNGAGGGPDISSATNYVSFDGGVSWRKLTDTHPFMMDTNPTATRNEMTYAIRGVLSGNVVYNGLWVSSEHMTTWRSIDPPGFGATDSETFAVTFWISPNTGEMVAVYGSVNAVYPPTTLWDTHDGGAHWTQLTTPSPASLSMAPNPYLVWEPGPHAPLTICNTAVGVTVDDQSGDFPLFCSIDDGKTWNTRPNIAPVDAAENTPQEVGSVFAIASDGSLLAMLPGQTVNTLYRLAPGASQWQSLGDVPSNGYTASYYTMAGGGMLWTDPAHSAPAIAALKMA